MDDTELQGLSDTEFSDLYKRVATEGERREKEAAQRVADLAATEKAVDDIQTGGGADSVPAGGGQ